MQTARRLAGAAALVLSTLAAAGGTAEACTCVSATPFGTDEHLANSRARAALVFIGKVVDVQSREDDTYLGDRLPFKLKHSVATFSADRGWKGVRQERLQVHFYGGKDSALCDFAFERGKAYLVFAYGKTPIATTCDFTVELEDEEAARTIGRLGPPVWTVR
jgi:hypothetical protein